MKKPAPIPKKVTEGKAMDYNDPALGDPKPKPKKKKSRWGSKERKR